MVAGVALVDVEGALDVGGASVDPVRPDELEPGVDELHPPSSIATEVAHMATKPR
jgi:hypothetical protein